MNAPLERLAWRGLDAISPWWRMLALLVAFTVVLAGMIWQQQQRLAHGREVILRVRPFDPRDLLLGHYVTLQFDISSIPASAFPSSVPDGNRVRGRSVYVVLRKEAGSPFWTLSRASWEPPAGLAPDEVMLKGRAQHAFDGRVRVAYGIERYYAPKERARALERLVRGRWRFDTARGRMVREEGREPPGIILKVDEQGRGIITGWLIDGRRVMEERLF